MKAIQQRFFMQVRLISEPEDFKVNSHLLDVITEEHFEDYLNCLKYGSKIKPAFQALDKIIELSKKLYIDTQSVLDLISQFSLLNSIFNNSKGTFPLKTADNLRDEVVNIWNAAEKYVLQSVGEICKGDAAYQDEPLDLDGYYRKHYR